MYLKNKGKEIKVITPDRDLKKFCEYTNIESIYFESFDPWFIGEFYKIPKRKKILDDLIRKIDFGVNDNFYLLNNVGSIEGYYLAKEFSKVGNVYNKNSAEEVPHSTINIKTLKNIRKSFYQFFIMGKVYLKILYKMFLGLDIVFYSIGVPSVGIDEDFLKKHKIKTTMPDKNYEELKLDVIKNSSILDKNYENVFLGPDLLKGSIKFESIKRGYKKILDLPIEFVIKKHPNKELWQLSNKEKNVFTLFKDYEEIPRYIPVELTFGNIEKNVVSVFSEALITASRFKNLKSISLLDLFEWERNSRKEEVRQWLIKESNNGILFPKNFNELEELLIE